MNKFFPSFVFVIISIVCMGCSEEDGYNPNVKISLNKSELTLEVGSSERLIASFIPDDVPNKAHMWLSNLPQIASVDDTGNVTAKGIGVATIVVRSLDSGCVDTCEVTVIDKKMPNSFVAGDTITFKNEYTSNGYAPYCLDEFLALSSSTCEWNGGNVSGTYAYSVIGANKAKLICNLYQPISGRSWYMDIKMTFDSSDSGTYECYESCSTGDYHDLKGTFKIDKYE